MTSDFRKHATPVLSGFALGVAIGVVLLAALAIAAPGGGS